ncbi:uroplakin-2-like isoform X1 [Pelobates fuscus]|uniref:uroplakin-2-like isoform X1 n=1 Tax=Pelobates fuscus TaxID=191477 RepID=UPI002FE4D70B
MRPRSFWMRCIHVTFMINMLNCVPMLLPNYEVSQYAGGLQLSTMFYLRPAYCLYEEWTNKVVNPSVAVRETSTITVQVQTDGDNSTYALPSGFIVPQCRPLFADLQSTGPDAYSAGPYINTLDKSRVQSILPGHAYKFRFVLLNAAKAEMAYTNWSLPFYTRDLPQSPSDMYVSLTGRSGGMVVITVLLSIAMFILLVGLALVFVTRKP